jgi:hypothetical protein
VTKVGEVDDYIDYRGIPQFQLLKYLAVWGLFALMVWGLPVADLEKFRSGGKSTDWGHSLYKFAKSKDFFFKYIQIL